MRAAICLMAEWQTPQSVSERGWQHYEGGGTHAATARQGAQGHSASGRMQEGESPVKGSFRGLCFRRSVGLVIVAAIALVAGLALVACGNVGSSNESKSASPASTGGSGGSGPIKIGVLTDLSGGIAADGTALHAAVELWANEVNAKGGLLGRPVELKVEDGATDPKLFDEKAKKLVGEHVDAFVGPILAAERLATQDTVLKAQIPYLYSTFYEGGAHGDLFFCTSETPQQTIEPWVPWIVQNYGKKVYLIGSDYQWPRKINSIVKRTLAAAGGQVVGEEYVALGTSDFSSALTRIQAAKPDVLFTTVVGTDGMALAKQFYDDGLSKNIKVSSAPFIENYAIGAGNAASEGINVCYGWFRDTNTPASQAFVQAIAKIDPKAVPTTITESTYAAMLFYGKAVEKAGSTDPWKVKAAMEGMTIDAPEGTMTMRATDHHCAKEMKIAIIHNGKYDIVKNLGLIQPGIDQRQDH
jgi:urea transport system substrate-binding protein